MPTSKPAPPAGPIQPRPRFEFKRDGEIYMSAFHDKGVGIAFELLREAAAGPRGEVTVQYLNGSADSRVHLHWARLELASTSGRESLAKKLASDKRLNIAIDDWRFMIEAACVSTVREFRKGEPFLDLADGEPILSQAYLIDPIIPENEPTVFFADGESGKGWVALAICLSLRLGGVVVPGFTPVRQCNSLYLDWETTYETNVRRQEYLCRGIGLHSRPNGIFYRRMTRPLADDITRIKNLVAEKDVGFVVIDSAGPASGAEVKDSEPAMAMMSAIRQIGRSSLVLGHVSKATAQHKGSDRGRMIGSTFYELLARSTWELRADVDTQPITIGWFHRKTNLGPHHKPFGLQLNFEDQPTFKAWFTSAPLDASAVVSQSAPIETRLELLLRKGAMDTDYLAEELDIPVRRVSRLLEKQEKAGKVVCVNPENRTGGRGKVLRWGLVAHQ